jgi:GNAT superfamily N-acetyltransferase
MDTDVRPNAPRASSAAWKGRVTELSIEVAQPHEVYAILELIEELLMELEDDRVEIPWVNREKLHTDIRRNLDTEAGTKSGPGRLMSILAKEPSGVAVGVLLLVESFALYAGGEYGVIDEMYVRPEYRGHDVERQLLDEAVAIATRRKWFHLDITGREGDRNEKAARFSRGLGL